jgi:hypothetical protein
VNSSKKVDSRIFIIWDEIKDMDREIGPDDVGKVLFELEKIPSAMPTQVMSEELIDHLKVHVPAPRFKDRLTT